MQQFNHPLRLYRGLQFLGALVAVSSITACSDDDDKCADDPAAPGCSTTGGTSTGGKSAVAGASNRGGSGASTTIAGAPSTGGAAPTTGTAGAAGATPATGGAATGGAAGSPGTGGTAGTPGVAGSTTTSTAGSPATGGTSAATGGSAPGGAAGATTKVCTNPVTDCPAPANECIKAVCNGQICGTTNVAAGTPTTAGQTAGDCKVKQCDGAGNIATVNDNTDVPVDTNPCTTETCASGTPSTANTAAGTVCESTKMCDGSGACVACIAPSDCPGTDTECKKRTCTAGVCGVSNTATGTATTSQTAGDCHENQCDGSGNVVNAVKNTDVPDDGKECTADTCADGVTGHTNQPDTFACGTTATGHCDGLGDCIGCTQDADCGTTTECRTYTCASSKCVVTNTAAGTATTTQTTGDCKKNQCDGAGNIAVVPEDTDLPASTACATGTCSSGTVGSTNKDARTSCGSSLICDGKGACVSCIDTTDCPGTDTDCQKKTCSVAGACGVSNTAVGTPTSTQVPGDCHSVQCDGAGNSANNIDDTDVPNDSKQCTTDTCTAGVPSNPNSPADTDCTEGAGKVCDGHGTCGPYNLAGNGDVEYGTTAGWATMPINAGVLTASSTAASGFAHTGQYSIVDSGRAANWQGPAYAIPNGPGKYIISAWGMQNSQATFKGTLNLALSCGTNNMYSTSHYVVIGAYESPMDQGVWTQFSKTVDTGDAAAYADCLSATPGGISYANLYLNQATSSVFPDFYLDDIVVQVTDGHNLIGVPTFELAGQMGGWGKTGGTPAISTAQFHTGAASLGVTGRTAAYAGPSYPLPIGKAVYNLSLWAMHTGTVAHDLGVTIAYQCVGDSSDRYATAATQPGVAASTWTPLTATNMKMPPAGGPTGCRLTAAKLYVQQSDSSTEYPDLFIDDASLTIAP